MQSLTVARPKPVLDLYQWIPPHGENSVAFQYDGSELAIDIYFDSSDEQAVEDEIKTIVFSGVCSLHLLAIPGIDILNLQYEEFLPSGALVEYELSEPAAKWAEILNWKKKPIRHFQMYFAAANRRVEVFAESFAVK